jgi:hypothetical protein
MSTQAQKRTSSAQNTLLVGAAGLDQRWARTERLHARGVGGTGARRREVSAAACAAQPQGWQLRARGVRAHALMGHQPKPGTTPMPPC